MPVPKKLICKSHSEQEVAQEHCEIQVYGNLKEEIVSQEVHEPIITITENTYDPDKFNAIKDIKMKFKASGDCMITNCMSSMRIELSEEAMYKLNNPAKLQVSVGDSEFAFGENLALEADVFNVKKSGRRGVIYNRKLVKKITQEFSLDFASRTTMTFYQAEYKRNGDNLVLVIKI